MKYRMFGCILGAALIFGGCATIGGMRPVQKMVVDSAVPTVEDLFEITFKSDDLVNARTLLETVLPLLDGMIVFSPDNKRLLTLAAEGYALYSFGFVEDEDRRRAIRLYAKGKAYGLRALEQNRKFKKALASGDDFSQALQTLTEDDVAAAFYTSFGWAFWGVRSIQEGDMMAAFDLPKITAMMNRVIELDERFFEGGPHLFYGVYYGALGQNFGGGPEKADAAFQKAFAISPDFLVTHYFHALYQAIPLMDERLFTKDLNHVLETPCDAIPEMALPNAVAKAKAMRLLKEKWKYFVE